MDSTGPDYTPLHPKGIRAKVLLTSVFGPYAEDNEFGSRTIHPMELYHNQVTLEQGISASGTLLDFPTVGTFEKELTRLRRYKNHPEALVWARFVHEARSDGAIPEQRAIRPSRKRCTSAHNLQRCAVGRCEIEVEFGMLTRLLRMILGPVLVWTSRREDRRLANGITYEPQIVERHNWVEEAKTGEQSKAVVMPKGGFAPSMGEYCCERGFTGRTGTRRN